jgi:hypothetical protein
MPLSDAFSGIMDDFFRALEALQISGSRRVTQGHQRRGGARLAEEESLDTDVVYRSDDLPTHCVCNKRGSHSPPCKVFGDFHCTCGNAWRSGNCWFNHTTGALYVQDCLRCNKKNEPTTFRACRFVAKEDSKGPHLPGLCARCKELGRDCSKLNLNR